MADKTTTTFDREQLDDDDLGIVYEELIDVSRKWYVIGLALGIPLSTLENIKDQHTTSFKKCLLELLIAWLKQIRKPRTWAAVVEALRRKSVDEHKLSEAIESKYCNTIITRSMSAPANVAQNVVEEIQHVKPRGADDAQHHSPKRNPHKHVQTAAASSSPQSRSLKLPSHRREGQTDTVAESGEEPLYPYLNVESLTEDERHALYGRLTIQYKRISSSYAKLNQDIRTSLTTRNITPSEVANVLMELSAFPLRVHDSSEPLLEDCLEKIEAATSIQAVFKILRPYGSFFDCHIIKHIVNSDLCTDGDRSKLKIYLTQLDDYCRRNVFECPHIASSDSSFPKLMLKVDDIVPKSFTMKSLDAFSAEVAETLNLNRHTLRVCSAEEGCVRLTYQISKFIVEKIFPLGPMQQKTLRSKLGISKLMCGSTWMYDLSVSEAQKQKVSHSDSVLVIEDNTGCIRYKLLGECPYGDHCHFGHLNKPIAFPSVGIVPAPTDKSIVGRAFQSSGGKGYVILEVKNDTRKVKIVAEDDLTLKFAKRVTLMNTSSTVSRFKYVYIHSEVLEKQDLFLRFTVHDGADPTAKTNYYHLTKVVQPDSSVPSSGSKISSYKMEELVKHLSTPDVKTGSQLDGLEFKQTCQVYSNMFVSRYYRNEIHERLREGLIWMKKKGFPHPKLEGRLGKVLWRKPLKGDYLQVQKCIKYLVEQESAKRSSFTSKIDSNSVEALRKINVQNLHSKAEEYLFSLQPKNDSEGQHFVCVAFEHGRPEIVYVTRHNKKDWVLINFDILCLHRKYDIRLSLRCIEKVSTTDPSLQRFISSSLSMSDRGVIHYNPKASKEEWSLKYIRHQKWESYNFRDSKYMIEIQDMGEYVIDEGDFSEHQIGSEDFKSCQTVELHSNSWDNYSDKYTHSAYDSPSTSHSWSPEQIMEEFEKDGFLKMLDELNQTMELVSTSV